MVALVGLAACDHSASLRQLNILGQGFANANKFIQESNQRQYDAIAREKLDPSTRTTAVRWAPVADKIKNSSQQIDKYLDSLRSAMEDSSRTAGSWQPTLFYRLTSYKKQLLAAFDPDSIDFPPLILKSETEELYKRLPLKLAADSKVWADSVFDDRPIAMLVALSKIKNDVLLSENMATYFCSVHIYTSHGGYEMPHLVASLSSSYVKAGQSIEVTAGIVEFSLNAEPTISVNGITIPLNSDNCATRTIKAPKGPGKHKIVVEGKYYKPDGTQVWSTKELEYVVAE